MPQQPQPYVVNNFSGGLKTEFTGLNFPENSSPDALNCEFQRIGNATRRLGIDYETNYTQTTLDRASKAISTYKWNNAGGDGTTQVIVQQLGNTLYFYRSSSATTSSPVSAQKLASTVDLSSFTASGGTADATLECQYADGNGYLFVYRADMDPIYCTYSAGTITGTIITVNIRDFAGIVETGVADTFRPITLNNTHNYNLNNQGWGAAATWTATSTTNNTCGTGSRTWTIASGLTITNGQIVNIGGTTSAGGGGGGGGGSTLIETGTVTSYSGTTLVLNVTSSNFLNNTSSTSWTFSVTSLGKLTTWNSATATYPSNSDRWWAFKNTTNVFDPATTVSNVTLNAGPAPKGFYILEAFRQLRSTVSGLTGLTDVTTTVRPRTGAWFQGRVWYTGEDAAGFSESIYFSQIIEDTSQFGKCYQVNDPTSQDLFDLLPSDGGIIRIQGCGAIYKLFPLHNGMLVFAANGIWYITGSQGIGFAANDFTVSKLSSIQSISSTSFVDVQGYPMWWNAEGIYTVNMGQDSPSYGAGRGSGSGGGLQVIPMTFASIQTFYDTIPISSKRYARGDFDSLDWCVKWAYKSSEASSTTNRYQFDYILKFNTATQSFSPWQLSTTSGVPYIHGVNYVQNPAGGSTAPTPAIKYLCSVASAGSYKFTFAEEIDDDYIDWHSSGVDYDYTSYFTSSYKIAGGANRKFQNNYINIYLGNTDNVSYKIQGIWDYGLRGDSGRFTQINTSTANFSNVVNRHRIRGRGLVSQFKIISMTGEPFDIIGWSVDQRVNTGV